MNNIVVFSEQSLYKYLMDFSVKKIYEKDKNLDEIIKVQVEDILYVFTKNKKDEDIYKQTLIVFKDLKELINENTEENLRLLFQKIHMYSHNIHKNKISSPRNWKAFHFDNKVSFVAFDYYNLNLKIILEIIKTKQNCKNIYVHGLVPINKDILEYDYKTLEYNLAIESLKKAVDLYNDELETHHIKQMGENLILNKSIFSEENIFSYDEWLTKLSKVQKKFVDSENQNSIKLRGPAGTGKTLAMEIKALKLLKENPSSRIIYLTHSWAVAEKVQDFIDLTIDDIDKLKRIDIFPLISLAESFTDKDKNVVMLGDDSFSGKILQLKIIENIVREYTKKNLPLLKETLSSHFFNRLITTDPKSFELLCWDLMIEFACVIGANGIMPGISAKNKYKDIERRPWMMTIEKDADKDFVINAYIEYIKYLVKNSEITSDQVINDFLNHLSTYSWYYNRAIKGYDYIFIDEMQLFNEQERMVFHFLTKSPDEYPILFIAIDPKQAIIETYFDDISANMFNNSKDETAEQTFGEPENIILGEVFRYTPQILLFLKHIDKSYPTLILNQEWNNNIKHAISNKKNGIKPIINLYPNKIEEVKSAIAIALSNCSKGNKTALLVMDNEKFKLVKENNSNSNTEYIESKEDTLKLKYKKRALVVSQPSYVIGLQFDVIIMLGCNIYFDEHHPNNTYNMRRYLSDLYLGCSRASQVLILTISSDEGNLPTLLNNAIEKKLISQKIEDKK